MQDGFMLYLKALWKHPVVTGKCHYNRATMLSPVVQLHSRHLCHDDARMADMKVIPSYQPLGRIVINLWLKDLEMF
jgi:hypothetical protein